VEGWFVLCGLSVMALIGYLLGQSRGKPVRGAMIGFLLGPVGWFLIVLSPNENPMCPYCKGTIVHGAQKCKNCGSRIPRCPSCNKQLGLKRMAECKHCGEELTGDEWPDRGRRVRG